MKSFTAYATARAVNLLISAIVSYSGKVFFFIAGGLRMYDIACNDYRRIYSYFYE